MHTYKCKVRYAVSKSHTHTVDCYKYVSTYFVFARQAVSQPQLHTKPHIHNYIYTFIHTEMYEKLMWSA